MRELICQGTWQLLQLPQICAEVINNFKLSRRFRLGVHLAFGLLHTATVICGADISEECAASTHSLFIAAVIADRSLTCSAPPVGPWDCLPACVNYALSFLTYFCPEDGGDSLLRNIGACRGYISLIECSSTGTTKNLPVGVNITIEIKNITTASDITGVLPPQNTPR